MKVLAVGGERSYVMGLLKSKFARFGLEFAAHWDYNNSCPDDIPVGTEGVLCFKDMMPHTFYHKAKRLASKQGLPFVAIPRKEALAIKVLQESRFITMPTPTSPEPSISQLLDTVEGCLTVSQSLLGSGTLALTTGTPPMSIASPKPVKQPSFEEWLPLIVESNPFLSVRETLEKLAEEVPELDVSLPARREAVFEAKVVDFDRRNPTPSWAKAPGKAMSTVKLLTSVERAREWLYFLPAPHRDVLTRTLLSADATLTVPGTKLTARAVIAPLLGKPQEIVTVMLLSIPDKTYSLAELHAAHLMLTSRQLGPYYMDASALMVGRGVRPRTTTPVAPQAPIPESPAAWGPRLTALEGDVVQIVAKATSTGQALGSLGTSMKELGVILAAVREAVAGLATPQAPSGESEEDKARVDDLAGTVGALQHTLAGLATRVGSVEKSFSALHAQVYADKNHALELLEGITPHLVAAEGREERLIKRIEALEARPQGDASVVNVGAPASSGEGRSPELTLRYLVEQGFGFTVVPPPTVGRVG